MTDINTKTILIEASDNRDGTFEGIYQYQDVSVYGDNETWRIGAL